MPVRFFPVTIRCPRCGWRQTWRPVSDALLADNLPPQRCPHCGHTELDVQRAGVLSSLAAAVAALHRRS